MKDNYLDNSNQPVEFPALVHIVICDDALCACTQLDVLLAALCAQADALCTRGQTLCINHCEPCFDTSVYFHILELRGAQWRGGGSDHLVWINFRIC